MSETSSDGDSMSPIPIPNIVVRDVEVRQPAGSPPIPVPSLPCTGLVAFGPYPAIPTALQMTAWEMNNMPVHALHICTAQVDLVEETESCLLGVFQAMHPLRAPGDTRRIQLIAAPVNGNFRQFVRSSGYRASIWWDEGRAFSLEGPQIWYTSWPLSSERTQLRLYDPVLPPLPLPWPNLTSSEERRRWRREAIQLHLRPWAAELWLRATEHLCDSSADRQSREIARMWRTREGKEIKTSE